MRITGVWCYFRKVIFNLCLLDIDQNCEFCRRIHFALTENITVTMEKSDLTLFYIKAGFTKAKYFVAKK